MKIDGAVPGLQFAVPHGMRRIIGALLCVVTWSAPASADTHLELSFAFIGGQRSYDDATFSYSEGTASPSLGGSFSAPPFSGVSVAGPGVETGLIVNNVRFSFGYHRPYARLSSAQRTAPLAETAPVQVHRVDIRELRYGVGYEQRFDRFALFADLIGTADTVAAKLTVGDLQSTYDSTNFGYSIRVGGRYAINRHYFAHASVEFGLGSNIDGNGLAGVGLRIP